MENTSEKKAHLFAGPKAVIAMGNKINEVCATTNENTARYQAGWNDERVLEHVNKNGFPEITLGHIKRLRKSLFGPLFNTPGGNNAGGQKSRIAAIEKQVADIEAYLTSKNPIWKTQV